MDKLELYDCTLREGEQAAGASFSLKARVKLFQELDEFGFDYIELGWPMTSKKVMESFKLCKKLRKNAKIVAFGSTSRIDNVALDENINSLLESESEYVCIFGKTRKQDIINQLKIDEEKNLNRIKDSIAFLKSKNIHVFYDAEHFFDGFFENKSYALSTLSVASQAGAERIILCDTRGGMLPKDVEEIVREVSQYIQENKLEAKLGVHFHNDCNLALANTLVSLPFINQVQGTINGTGERIGNLSFSDFIPIYVKKLGKSTDVNLGNLKKLFDNSFRYAGLHIPADRAFVGDNAFTHKGGSHIDALNKDVDYEHETPGDFGNKRIVLLSTLGGRGSVVSVARELGYVLDKNNPVVKTQVDQLFEELGHLESRGYNLGAMPAEQFLLMEKYFGNLKTFFNIGKYDFKISVDGEKETSLFDGKIGFEDLEMFEISANVLGGPIDAAYKAIQKTIGDRYPEVMELKLVDFQVDIAKNHGEESSVRTIIEFKDGESFRTVGVDKNIIKSSIEALAKGFRYYLNRKYNFK